jgi:uncharacterized protein (TIGR03435 family)
MITMHLVPALNFLRKSLLLIAAMIALTCPMLLAQDNTTSGAPSSPTPTTNVPPAPSFDVATIKPHPGILTMTGVMNAPDGVDGSAATLSMLVEYAYGLRSEDQVSGGPDWTKTDRFDVQARMGEADIAAMEKLSSAEKKASLKLMMQSLLAERFKLKVHSETKQVPVYELVVAKGGSKLKDAATDTSDPLLKGKDGKPLHGFLSWTTGKIVAQGYSAKNLAEFLSQPICALGRPVMDKTGLTGTYNFTLDWTPPHPGVRFDGESDSASPEDAPSIFAALADLGLKLQPSTGPLETIIIDHVEKPSEN